MLPELFKFVAAAVMVVVPALYVVCQSLQEHKFVIEELLFGELVVPMVSSDDAIVTCKSDGAAATLPDASCNSTAI